MSQAVPTQLGASPPPREQRDNFASFSAGPVDSVTYVAIAALVVIIFVAVATLTCMFRRRARYWQQHAVEAALHEASERAAGQGKEFVMPVVISQPDGSFQLAEELREEATAVAGAARDGGSSRGGGGAESGGGGGTTSGLTVMAAAVVCLERHPLGHSTGRPGNVDVGNSGCSHAGSASSSSRGASLGGPGTPQPPV